MYDTNLPIPAAADIETGRAAWWACRFCGFIESGPLAISAEARRCAAHEYRCQARPASNIPSEHERAAYQVVHAAGLRRDLLVLACNLDDRMELLRCTWFFDFAGKRAHKNEIAKLNGRIAGIHAHALALGLDDGWSDPSFRPAALR